MYLRKSSTSFPPEEFLFGAASSAFQVEGAWDADGKGETIWDRVVHTKPELVKKEENADVACDSYHRFKEDVALIKEIGFQVYRFSISWARILPDGEISSLNETGVDYYRALIDELVDNGIQPMVTMYHWDLPQRLQDMGGWMNPVIIDYMEDYADLLFQLYGEKVKLWITINEPEWITDGYSGTKRVNLAPALYLDSPINYIVAYNLLRAHARIYRLYERKFRAAQNGKISIVMEWTCHIPKTSSKEDVQATERAWAFRTGIFAHPIYSEEGDFPEIIKTIVAANSQQEGRKRSRLPQFTDEEIRALKGSSDFFGLNHYETHLCTVAETPHLTLGEKDRNMKEELDPKWNVNHLHWPIVPWGLREVLRSIKDRYNNPPVFITENGYGTEPNLLNDRARVNYHRDYLRELLIAKEEYGCNVIGYIVWSLLDSFEWYQGYECAYGLVHVDFTDPKRKRTQKSSAKFFKQLLKTRCIPEEIDENSSSP